MTTIDTARTAAPLSFEDLRAAVRGRVITPGDPDYDRARTLLIAAWSTGARPSSSRSPTPPTSPA